MKRKHGLFFFISSCVPGCGQMHQGYMKRGLSLLLIACAIFALSLMLSSGLVIFLLPVWLYAFFDSYNLRTLLDLDTPPADEALLGLAELDTERLSTLLRRRHSLVGWGLVLLGLHLLYDSFLSHILYPLFSRFDHQLWWIYDMAREVPRLAATVFIIGLGIWFIRGPKASPAEDIPPFVPPVGEDRGPGAAPADGPAAEPPVSETAEAAVNETAEAPSAPAEQEADHA